MVSNKSAPSCVCSAYFGQCRMRILRSCATALAMLCLSVLGGCSRHSNHPDISEYPPLIQLPDYDISLVPVILVGQVLRTSAVDAPRRSKWDERIPTQLNEVTVRVENVLKGSVKEAELPIYYFRFPATYTYNGPALLGYWKPGDRMMFFLQKDSGVLRTVCDNYRGCVVPVLTGFHPARNGETDLDLVDNIQRILLSRGEKCSDEMLIQAMSRPASFEWQQQDLVRALERLAIRETGIVRRGACGELAYLGDVYVKYLPNPQEAALRSACGSVLKDHPASR
jgi:hypothetical protein